ncbi:STM3941 family protein [Isoptericola haloaureus]|uniref:STM3941 family protein n=1 Tax=Isoptericola haloaureus TaxID=1542902 RepID=A0ABU7Z670_9MICO
MTATDAWDQRLLLGGEVRISGSRWRLVGYLAIAVAFAVVGVWMWLDAATSRLMSGFVLGFAGIGVLVFLWQIVRPVFFVVTRGGIRYKGRAYPWDDLLGVEEINIARARMVLLRLDESAAERMASSSGTTRTLMAADTAVVGAPGISIPGPFPQHRELVSWLEATRARFSSRPSRPDPSPVDGQDASAVTPRDVGARRD